MASQQPSSKFFTGSEDPVSFNRNWQQVIEKELGGQKMWWEDWGFLAGGDDKEYQIDKKIQELEKKISSTKQDKLETTQRQYGKEVNGFEMFFTKTNNLLKNPEIRACERRPKKK